MMPPYRYNKKDDIWQLRSICDFCKREGCQFRQKDLTGCTEFDEGKEE